MFNTKKYEKATCPRCGKLFPCSRGPNCWCFEIEIPEKVRDFIEMNYAGCLCKECLTELINNDLMSRH